MSGRSRAPRVLVALCAVVVAVILGQARVALADEGLRVEGMDYFYGSSAAAGSDDSSVDILSVSGAANQTVYVEMDRDGVTIASHLAFTLGDSTAKRDDAGRYVGVVSAKIANFQPMSTYGVRVFADREQTQSLFEGSITPVFADLDGAPRRLLALRTVASGDDRAFTAPANVTFGNASYKLANDAPVSEAPLAFSYTQSDAAESIAQDRPDPGHRQAREPLRSRPLRHHGGGGCLCLVVAHRGIRRVGRRVLSWRERLHRALRPARLGRGLGQRGQLLLRGHSLRRRRDRQARARPV